MKVIKPRTLGVLYRFYEFRREFFLAVAAFLHFPFARPRALFSEQELWPFVQGELGGDQPLDLGLPKPYGEVLLLGRAHAPGGREVASLEVGLTLGPVKKTLMLHGDRTWQHNPDHFDRLTGHAWLRSASQPFREMTLGWELAYGGPDFPDNPLGRGFLADGREPAPDTQLPNLEHADQRVANPWSRPRPAGFGPLDLTWPFRQNKVGTHDQNWAKNLYPGFAEDMDWSIWNAAPPDQWVEGYWRGDEAFTLTNLHPDQPRLEGALPGLNPRVFLEEEPPGEPWREVALHPETVWLFPETAKGVLVCRGQAPIASWDGREIKNLLLAYEHLGGARREPAAYQAALERRRDPKEAVFWLMREDDLAPPEGVEVPTPAETGPKPPPVSPALLARAARLQEKVQQEFQARLAEAQKTVDQNLAKFQALAAKLGVAPGGKLPPSLNLAERLATPAPPPVVPPPPSFAGLGDAPAMMKYLQEEIPKLRAQAQAAAAKAKEDVAAALAAAQAKQGAAQDAMAAMCRRFGLDPAATLAKAGEAAKAGPPDPVAALAAMRDKLAGAALPAERKKAALAQVDQGLAQLKNGLAQKDAAQAALAQGPAQAKLKAAKVKSAHALPPPELPAPPARVAGAAQALAALAAGESLAGRDLTGLDFSGAELAAADLRQVILDSATLAGARLAGAKLGQAILARADLTGAELAGADLSQANLGACRAVGANLAGCLLDKAVLQKADFSRARLTGVSLGQGVVQGVNFTGADLTSLAAHQVTFLECDFTGAKLGGAVLTRASFLKCNLTGADFTGANAAQCGFLEVQGRGAVFDQADLSKIRLAMGTDFTEARFRGAQAPASNWRESDLTGADFTEALLDGADLSRCHLAGAGFYHARGRKAQFVTSDLSAAQMAGADFMEASFMRADLRGADLRGASLFGANTFGAVTGDAVWGDTDVRRTTWDQGGGA
ncbi:MAG: DUF2169 domain-containing protein [Deltaproteobacteria bacterium]|nr:DUF2169 domain-containing protein [Deltaproteobacteria bacterium]